MEPGTNLKNIRIAGTLGVIACIIAFAEFPLWFVGESMPRFWDETAFSEFVARHNMLYLTRTLMDLFILSLLIVFFGGFRYLIVIKNASYEWLATTFLVVAAIYTTLTLISDSFAGTIGLHTLDEKVNPTVVRTLNESTLLLYGSVTESLIATMMVIAGILIFRTKALPRWTGWLALFAAVWNLAFVPTMYFGTDFTKFYSAAGDGPAATAPVAFVIWILSTAICMMRKRAIDVF
jgi:hypothetical protein